MKEFEEYQFVLNRGAPIRFEDAQRRYDNDPLYRNLVDAIFHMIDRLEMSPSEARAATMFACYRHELMVVKPIRVGRP